MTNDSDLFRSVAELEAEGAILNGNIWRRGDERWLPLYEAKMVHHFNHRDGDYTGYIFEEGKEVRTLHGPSDAALNDPVRVVQPRYWVAEAAVRAASKTNAMWLLGFRDITNTTTNRRTMIDSVVPPVAIGNKLPLLNPLSEHGPLLPALLSSFVVDYTVRQKLGGTTLNFFIAKQLPVLAPQLFDAAAPWSRQISTGMWFTPRVVELTYTAWDLEGFAQDLGYEGPPFRWERTRREILRAELDAAYFHLYGIERDDIDYIMETFPIVKRKDIAEHGEYHTKRLILEVYDAMAKAIESHEPYLTILAPPPADPSCAHDLSTRPSWAAVTDA
jgi:hypothetical protein